MSNGKRVLLGVCLGAALTLMADFLLHHGRQSPAVERELRQTPGRLARQPISRPARDSTFSGTPVTPKTSVNKAVVPGAPQPSGTITYTITACIDGEERLVIRGSTLQWEHESFQAVGLTDNCQTSNTSVTTTFDGKQVLARKWQPTWPSEYSAGEFVPAGVTSSVLTGLSPALPTGTSAVALTVLEARHQLSIAQLPSAANNWTLILDFNDSPIEGSANYSAEITVTNASSPSNGIADNEGRGAYPRLLRREDGTPTAR